MKLEKILFILSILGILIIIFLSQTTAQTHTGKIKSIETSSKRIVIQLENSPIELILFETNLPNIQEGDVIEFQGKEEVYKNQTQIIVDKIILIG